MSDLEVGPLSFKVKSNDSDESLCSLRPTSYYCLTVTHNLSLLFYDFLIQSFRAIQAQI